LVDDAGCPCVCITAGKFESALSDWQMGKVEGFIPYVVCLVPAYARIMSYFP